MINTRKTVAAGVAAAIGMLSVPLATTYGLTMKMGNMPSGEPMYSNQGVAIEYCVIKGKGVSDPTASYAECSPSTVLPDGDMVINPGQGTCFNFYTTSGGADYDEGKYKSCKFGGNTGTCAPEQSECF